MKTRILAVILILGLIAVSAATAAPAGLPTPVAVSLSGSVPTLSCTFSVSPTTLSFGNNMLPGNIYTTPSGTASITCNYPWTIGVSDLSAGGNKGKPAGYLWNATDTVNLSQPFKLTTPTGSITLTSPGTFTSNGGGTFNYGFSFSQNVTGSDSADLYSTTVTFTVSLT